MSEFYDEKPEAKHEQPAQNIIRNHQDAEVISSPNSSQGPQARDLFSVTQSGEAGMGQPGSGGTESLSQADLIPHPEYPALANTLARDTIDDQLFTTGVRRVTPMEVSFNGQRFTGSMSADRSGNRFITDGQNTYRIYPGDANNPHGYIQLSSNRDIQPVPIAAQRVLSLLGEDAFRLPNNSPIHIAAEHNLTGGIAHNTSDSQIMLETGPTAGAGSDHNTEALPIPGQDSVPNAHSSNAAGALLNIISSELGTTFGTIGQNSLKAEAQYGQVDAQPQIPAPQSLEQNDRNQEEQDSYQFAGRLPDEEVRGAGDIGFNTAAEAAIANFEFQQNLTADKEEQTDKDKQEAATQQEKRDPDKRQRYLVREGDTLESIAGRQLRDKRLAGLIYEINRDLISTSVKNGKTIVELEPRLIIYLPNAADIRSYRARLLAGMDSQLSAGNVVTEPKYATAEDELIARFGNNWDAGYSQTVESPVKQKGFPSSKNSRATAGMPSGGGETIEDMEESARIAYQARRKNIEDLLGPLSKDEQATDKLQYVVRLGDTLKSIAMKHPAMNDVTLWRLLADINGLPHNQEDRRAGPVPLKRGQVLILPAAEEIANYRTNLFSTSSTGKYSSPAHEDIQSANMCPHCENVCLPNALICTFCRNDLIPGVNESQAKISDDSQSLSDLKTESGDMPSAWSLAADNTSSGTLLKNSDNSILDSDTSSILKAAGFIDASPAQLPGSGNDTRIIPDSTGIASSESFRYTDTTAYRLIEQYTDYARMMQAGQPDKLSEGFKLCLEILIDNTWQTVIAYELYENTSTRHEFYRDGFRKTLRIDLPSRSAIELASNDISSNWQDYCDKFMNSQ